MPALPLNAQASAMASPTDRITPELIARAQQGEMAAFEAIYHLAAPRVFGLCLRLAGSHADAAELTQDAFVRLWERLGTFRGESAFATWLHRLTTNVVFERRRADRRRAARVEAHDATILSAPHHTRGDLVESRLDLDAALARLGETARTVFVLREMEGYAYEEISELTGLSEVALRSQFHRARKQLMEMLA